MLKILTKSDFTKLLIGKENSLDAIDYVGTSYNLFSEISSYFSVNLSDISNIHLDPDPEFPFLYINGFKKFRTFTGLVPEIVSDLCEDFLKEIDQSNILSDLNFLVDSFKNSCKINKLSPDLGDLNGYIHTPLQIFYSDTPLGLDTCICNFYNIPTIGFAKLSFRELSGEYEVTFNNTKNKFKLNIDKYPSTSYGMSSIGADIYYKKNEVQLDIKNLLNIIKINHVFKQYGINTAS